MAISFACGCGKQFSVDDSMAGRRARCPRCGSVVVVPATTVTTPSGSKTVLSSTNSQIMRWVLLLGSLTAASTLWAILATWSLIERNHQLEEALRRLQAADSIIPEAVKKAEAIKQNAMWQAETIKGNAQDLEKQAEASWLREEEKLHTIYPRLHKLAPGVNLVQERYLESLEINGDGIKMTFKNMGPNSIYPHYYISFLNREGFVTWQNVVCWSFSTVESGETRLEEQPFLPQFGPAVYYVVQFK